MSDKNSRVLFNSIAPVYSRFFTIQRKWFRQAMEKQEDHLDFSSLTSVLDVGCGTGALCSVLAERGLSVTGLDSAEKMLKFASSRPENRNVHFIRGDVQNGLPFPDRSFDAAVASYVAHGMEAERRLQLYREMSRVARRVVVIMDYNQERSLLTSFVEWLEGGDYFGFIRQVPQEMEVCTHQGKRCFSKVDVVQIGGRAAWYVCIPHDRG
ncbi:class I SAM-dependent methyltransferase [Clostridiaceae bacterium HFYG-1003]|nr:class I SAM-dependent methyltransferase [Clostridiaceae bacterium HFYG-1003]